MTGPTPTAPNMTVPTITGPTITGPTITGPTITGRPGTRAWVGTGIPRSVTATPYPRVRLDTPTRAEALLPDPPPDQ